MLKLGNETKDSTSPLFTFINTAAPPVALNVLIASFWPTMAEITALLRSEFGLSSSQNKTESIHV